MINYFHGLIENLTPMSFYFGSFGLSCFILGMATKDMGQPIKWNAAQIVYVILCILIISFFTLLIHE